MYDKPKQWHSQEESGAVAPYNKTVIVGEGLKSEVKSIYWHVALKQQVQLLFSTCKLKYLYTKKDISLIFKGCGGNVFRGHCHLTLVVFAFFISDVTSMLAMTGAIDPLPLVKYIHALKVNGFFVLSPSPPVSAPSQRWDPGYVTEPKPNQNPAHSLLTLSQ